MKQIGFLAAGIVIGALAVSAPSQRVTEDPVRISPQYYSVRFENDRVRVLEYRLKPGEREPMHSHPPGVTYHLNDATGRATVPEGTVSDLSVTKGGVSWREATRHALENTGTTDVHALAIELKSSCP